MTGPILPSTVHRILAHISPLDDPLPPSLISKPLLKRHLFLGLTLDDGAEYLAWPSSSDQPHLLQLLERPLQDLGDHIDAQYTTDSEELLAHVCISSELRLVFLWEEENGWQYHNLATMPFPSNSIEDFNDAYSLYSKNDFLSESAYEVTVSGGDGDDSYWNSYGEQQDDSPHHLSASKPPEDIASEDAYWARYSTIQGSADSTIPSPIPPGKTIKSGITDLEKCHDRIITVPPAEFQIHHVEPYNPFEPPSPEGISRRLQALSSEPDMLSSPLVDEPDSGCEMNSPYRTDVDTSPTTVESQIPADDHDVAFRMVLQDTIKNVYKLWRMGRKDNSAEQDKKIFVDAVQHTLEGL